MLTAAAICVACPLGVAILFWIDITLNPERR